jgi:hypothetical protein
MRLAEELGYAVIVTVDQGIPFQQPMRGRKISLVVIRSKSNQLKDLLPFVDAALLDIETLAEGTLNFVPSTLFADSRSRLNYPLPEIAIGGG